MLDLSNEIDLVVRDKDSLRGIVRLGTSETLVHTWLPEVERRGYNERLFVGTLAAGAPLAF